MRKNIFSFFIIIFLLLVFTFFGIITQAEKIPSPPDNLRILNKNNNSIKICWEKGFYPDSKNYFVSNADKRGTHDLINPCAEYSSISNCTYIVYSGLNQDPYIVKYNHSTGLWSDSFRVGINPLEDDDHGHPSMVIDKNGYIHVFYGCHNTAIKHKVSSKPYMIDSWNYSSNIIGAHTYPIPKLIDDDIYLLCKGSDYDIYLYNLSNSSFFGKKIIGFPSGNWVYIKSLEKDSKNNLHISFNYYNKIKKNRYDIYHAIYNLKNNSLTNITGFNLGENINFSEAERYCRAYNSGLESCYNPTMHLDSNDNPYIIFTKMNEYHNENMTCFIYWNGYKWTKPVEITSCKTKWETSDFIINDNNTIDVFLTVNKIFDRGGRIEKWRWDGKNWFKIINILRSENNTKTLVHPTICINNSYEIKIIFSEYSDYYNQNNLKMYAYGEGGIVKKNNETVYTMIRYSTEDNLTDINSGWEIYNGTGINTVINNNKNDTTYYLRAWSFDKKNGWNNDGSNILLIKKNYNISITMIIIISFISLLFSLVFLKKLIKLK